MDLRWLVLIGAVVGVPSRASAEEVAAAAAARFAECLATEGTELSATERAELVESLGGFVARFGAIDCEREPARCVEAIHSSTCDAMAEALIGQIAPDIAPIEVPEWASAYANAVRDRVVACFVEESGAAATETERLAIESYGQSIAVGMATLARQMDCGVHAEAAAQCTASIASQPCEVLAGELVADENGNFAGIDPSCAEMLDCMQAFDEMVRQEER